MSPPLSVSKDEYLADLYHFATKEDTYANYFIHVSPKTGFQPLGLRGGHQGPWDTFPDVGGRDVFLWTPGRHSIPHSPWGCPLVSTAHGDSS